MSIDRKLIIVKRRTRLEDLIVRYNTIQQAQFFIERMGADFSDYLQEDRHYRAALVETMAIAEQFGRVQLVDRDHVPNLIFGKEDTVIAVGQDGLVAGTLKYLDGQPLIGVNPDPRRWDGVLLPFQVADLRTIVPEVLQERRAHEAITLAKAELNDGQVLYAVNDLFIGRKTHVSARYQLHIEGKSEQQSSSGVIVSTGLGATGWLSSVLAGAAGVVGGAAHLQERGTLSVPKPSELAWDVPAAANDKRGAWGAENLYYTVREPYPSLATGASLVFGSVSANSPLRIVSQMPENGVIFSDGMEQDYLTFNAGFEATISIAEQKGRLII